MKSFFLTCLLPALGLLVAVGGTALAQAPADGGPKPTAPTSIPLDGGVSLLLAGGVAYGMKHLRSRKRS